MASHIIDTINGLRARWHIRRLRIQERRLGDQERDALWQRLVSLGRGAVGPLVAAFERDGDWRWIVVLSRIDDDSASTYVERQLSSSQLGSRCAAIAAVAEGEGWPRCAPVIWGLLADRSRDVRRVAGRALLERNWGETDDQRARIAEAAEDVDAAAKLPVPLVAGFYRRVLREESFSWQLRDAVIKTLLGKDRETGAELLIDELNWLAANPSRETGVTLIRAVGELKTPAAFESFGRLLRPEAHRDVREAAARALIELGLPSAAALAAPYLRTASGPEAILVILKFGGAEYLEDVLRVLTELNQYHYQVPLLAATYLRRYGGERAVALQARFLRSSDHDTVQAAVDHLARFGNAEVALSVMSDAIFHGSQADPFISVFRGIWNLHRAEMEAALLAGPAKSWADAIVILPADSGVVGLRPVEELLRLAESVEPYGNTDIAEAIIRSGGGPDERRVVAALTRAAGPDNYYKAIEGFGRLGLASTVSELIKCLDSPCVVERAYLALECFLRTAASRVSDEDLNCLRMRLDDRVRTVSVRWDGDALQPVGEGSIDVAELSGLVEEELSRRGERLLR